MCNPTKTEAILMQGYYQQVATTALIQRQVWLCTQGKDLG